MIFSRTVLGNGMRVLSERMPEVRSVAVGFWVGVGSRDEQEDLQGSSHFLEHLLFKGTEKRSARDIAEAFDAVGGEANAFSAKEYTCLHARVLDEDLPMAVEFLSDMLSHPAMRADEVESERSVILEEIAMHEDTPDDLVHDLFAEAVFDHHALGRSILGTSATVGAATPATLLAFHSANYLPGNVVVSGAGNIEHEELVGWIESFFPPEEATVSPRDPQIPGSPAPSRIIRRTTEQAHLVVGGMGYARSHPDRFAWGVLDSLLGGGMSSRLFQEIRERRGLAYSVYSYRNLYRETGLWAVYAGTSPSNAAQVLDIIGEEIDKIVSDGVTEAEVERAKGHVRGGIVLSLEDPSSRMSRLGKSELVHGEILSVDELVSRVNAVQVEDVERVARDMLGPKNRVLAAIGPNEEDSFSAWRTRAAS